MLSPKAVVSGFSKNQNPVEGLLQQIAGHQGISDSVSLGFFALSPILAAKFLLGQVWRYGGNSTVTDFLKPDCSVFCKTIPADI